MDTIITSAAAPRTAHLISGAPVALRAMLMDDANELLSSGASDEQVYTNLSSALSDFEG